MLLLISRQLRPNSATYMLLNILKLRFLLLTSYIRSFFMRFGDNNSANNQSCCNCGCIDESKISSDYNCDDYYEPVCGCDGITYGNECYAENAGVTDWIDGECELDDEY